VTTRPTEPGLYVHLPFCSQICPYCDFYVLTGDRRRQQAYVEFLLQEIKLCSESPWPDFVDETPTGNFDTLYLGGGTPSILTPDDLSSIFEAIQNGLPMAAEPWIGLEANPEDVTEENLSAWRQQGVRFLSLGVQSFDERALRFLGRLHKPETCRQSIEWVRKSGIETLSLDLIYGLPGQTVDDWRADLQRALELQPDHLACYQLTIEPQTPFGFRKQRGDFEESSPELQADLFFLTHRFLEDGGFSAYEVSTFAATPDHRSQHNSKYWDHTPYLGVGPSAHSFAHQRRWWNLRKIKPYEAKIASGCRPIQGHEILSASQLGLERLMLGLRTPQGVDFSAFPEEVADSLWRTNHELIDELESQELLQVEDRRLRPTLAGLALAEAITRRFELSAPERKRIC